MTAVRATIALEGKDALRTMTALQKGIQNFGNEGAKSVGQVNNAFSTLKGVVGGALVLKGLDLTVNAFKQGAKSALDFGVAIQEINSIAPRTSAETLALKQQLIGLSNEFGGNAQKQARAFYNIVSAGVQGTAQQLNVLEAANKAAVAGLVDIDTSAQVLVSSVNSYASAGLTAQQASDVLFNTVREGITTFGELAGSLGTVAPLANAAGLKFSELGGTLAFLTKSGISTAEATTGLRAILTGVIKPSEEAAKFAKGLGLEFNTSSIRAKGFAGFLQEVIQKTGGTETALAKLFPNVRALGPVIQIANGNFEDFARILDATADSSGATQAAFDTITKSAGFQFDKLTNQLKNFPTAILTNFEGPISDALQAINEFIGSKGILLVVDAVDVLLSAFDNVQMGVANVKVGLAAVAAGAAELGIKWTELALAVNQAVQSTASFLGLDASENLKKEETALQARIQGLKDFQKAQEEGAVAEINSAREVSTKVEAFRQKIAEGRAKQVEQEDERREAEFQKDQENAQKQLEQALTNEQTKFNAIAELKAANAEIDKEKEEEAKLARQLEADENFQFLADNLGKEQALRELNRIQQIEDEKKRNAELKKLREKAIKEEQAGIFAVAKFENLTNKQKIAAQKATLGAIASLTSSSNKTLFNIGKAASLAQAGINVAEGVTKALSAFPPPFNIAAGVLVGAAGAVNIAKIAAAKPPPSAGSFQSGGIISGPSQTGDQLTANVNGGEAIFNQRQQKNLFRAVDSGQLGGGNNVTLNVRNLSGSLTSQDTDMIIDALNTGLESGNKRLGALT